LTALAQCLAEWVGSGRVLIDLEGHGREELFEEIDLSRTVGWFTSLFPVLLDLKATPQTTDNGSPIDRTVSNDSSLITDSGEAIKSIKEQLRQIPNGGIGYGLLRYLKPGVAERLQALPQAQVNFNYLGQFDFFGDRSALTDPLSFRWAKESAGLEVSPTAHRHYLLAIEGMIIEGQLTFDCMYSNNFHHETTIEQLAQRFIEALAALIVHCQSPETQGYTPSDFPEMGFSQDELDDILDDFAE